MKYVMRRERGIVETKLLQPSSVQDRTWQSLLYKRHLPAHSEVHELPLLSKESLSCMCKHLERQGSCTSSEALWTPCTESLVCSMKI